jgi:imidazoleglycerol-phosphate dehydratase
MRVGRFRRKTKETDIEVVLTLDGIGRAEIETPLPFFNHVLCSFAFHGFFDLSLKCTGDKEVDDHHIIEDVGISLGSALKEALKNSNPIRRFGFASIPMDDALANVSIDLSGRSYLSFAGSFLSYKIGSMSTQMIPHFLRSFATSGGITLHVSLSGENDHHKAEALFKALGVALDCATTVEERRKGVPSTKGSLDS